MKSGCESTKTRSGRSIELPVLGTGQPAGSVIARSKSRRWRAIALVTLTLLMVAHVIQWKLMGSTISPIEPSESMYTLQDGAINAGFIFFSLAILATLILGRYVCGWGCHIVALQDLCTWMLQKIGLTPRPFRSRLLMYVPMLAAFYMFVWPTLVRAMFKPPGQPLIPEFTNHLITTDFWATFPGVAVAIPFFLICGFVIVYFLGSKGFCTYGCPYGGVFVIADKFAPGRIRVTDDCNQCGHCTATCTANVQVHAEVAKYGMVVDAGCMKHMDCISVCPKDALYFGFGKPSIAVSKTAVGAGYSLTWPEEILAAVIFTASYLAVWDVYQLVPMLMALGIAAITTFLAMKTLRIARTSDSAFYRHSLRSAGRIQAAGWIFIAFSLIWISLNAHSGYVRYHERAGAVAFERVQVADELALARPNPTMWLSPSEREIVADGKRHFNIAFNAGLFANAQAISKLAWLEYLSGDAERALVSLGTAAEHQSGQAKALSLYYQGAILNRLGRYEAAIASLERALAERNDLIIAREEKGEALWQLGRRDDAVAVWREVIGMNSSLPLSNSFLAGAAAASGNPEEAAAYEAQAARYTPANPYFHWMLGLRLQNVGMSEMAEKHFAEAEKLDPQFRARLGGRAR